MVQLLLANNANVELANKSRQTPLNIAIMSTTTSDEVRPEIVALLVKKGANVNQVWYSDEETPLLGTIRRGSSQVVAVMKILLAGGANVNQPNKNGRTPLYMAAAAGYQEVVDLLLAHGAHVDKQSLGPFSQLVASLAERKAGNEPLAEHSPTPMADVHDTPLYSAAANGKRDAVHTLLAAGADVNKANKEGKTPLYAAAARGYLEVVEALLAADAEVNKASEEGITPLQISVRRWDNASAEETVEVVRALLTKGADTEVATNTAQATPLYMAITDMHSPQTGQRLGVVQALVEFSANVNLLHSKAEQTLLIAAICKGNSYGGVEEALAIVKILLDAKANPNQANKKGDTPLYEAATRGYKEIIDTLVSHGADVDKQSLEACPQLLMPLAARQAANDPVMAALTEKTTALPAQPGLTGSGTHETLAPSPSPSSNLPLLHRFDV